jgi:hypothetical protein
MEQEWASCGREVKTFGDLTWKWEEKCIDATLKFLEESAPALPSLQLSSTLVLSPTK